jgi:hypothetical protein
MLSLLSQVDFHGASRTTPSLQVVSERADSGDVGRGFGIGDHWPSGLPVSGIYELLSRQLGSSDHFMHRTKNLLLLQPKMHKDQNS